LMSKRRMKIYLDNSVFPKPIEAALRGIV